jgi:hypothetical protein
VDRVEVDGMAVDGVWMGAERVFMVPPSSELLSVGRGMVTVYGAADFSGEVLMDT